MGFACAACSSTSPNGSVATSPAHAALGYDASQNAKPPAKLKFSCPDTSGPQSSFSVLLTGPLTASTVRLGDKWRVTVREAGTKPDAPSNTYDVRRKGHGYCVVDPVTLSFR
jgi:hypothetical protein